MAWNNPKWDGIPFELINQNMKVNLYSWDTEEKKVGLN